MVLGSSRHEREVGETAEESLTLWSSLSCCT